jgi:transposase-like protein
MRKLLKNYAVVPEKLVADDLRSYGAADGLSNRHERGRWRNNRAENSHQPAAACQKPNRLPLELRRYPSALSKAKETDKELRRAARRRAALVLGPVLSVGNVVVEHRRQLSS